MDSIFLSFTVGSASAASALRVVAIIIAAGALLGGLSGLALTRLGIRPASQRHDGGSEGH